MSQQHHDLGYLDYPPHTNRSPGFARHNYIGANTFSSSLSLPRHSQRSFDSPLGSALYPVDRLAVGFHPRPIEHNAAAAVAMPAAYMLENGHPWNYSGVSSATLNGSMHASSRQRAGTRRAALPQNWTDHGGMSMPAGLQPFPGGLNGTPVPGLGLRIDQGSSHASPDLRSATASDGDQLIPTAIVIKNIPFAVRKEALASIMIDMNLPQPYAFNYHFDNGVFRGLAFANFQSAEDTRAVIEAMNGMDVHGRKLRVEYKKMLPEAERERIEREKRERRGQLEEQHRAPILHQQTSIQSLGGLSHTPQPRSASGHLGDLDLNDPQTLEFYTELVMFKRDDLREILVFPPTISPEHRRSIHILAHHMGLEHQSIGEADARQLTVLKRQQPSPTANVQSTASSNLEMHKRGLSRAATFDFAADRDSRTASSNYAHVMGRQGPTIELPGSPDGNSVCNNLRAAKSFADLRSFTPSPSQASSTYLNPGSVLNGIAPGPAARFGDYMATVSQPCHPAHSGTPVPKTESSLVSGLSGLSLGSYEPNSLHAQGRNAPGAIGSQRPGANGTNGKSNSERQPRGPEWESSPGFSTLGRANGHMQRTSADSS